MIDRYCSRINSSITSRLSDNPMTSVLDDTTRATSGAGRVYWTRSRLKSGLGVSSSSGSSGIVNTATVGDA